jgi:DNA-binding HxlR family transcriptional regulator
LEERADDGVEMIENDEPGVVDVAVASPRCDGPQDQEVVSQLFRRVGDRWSLVVITQLRDGPVRFTTLLRRIDGISHRLLATTLQRLTDDGLVAREAYAEVPPRVEYSLTARGVSLLEPIGGMADWALGRR